MRTFSKGRMATAIARLLTLAFVSSTWLTGIAALPAGAQIVTRTATTQSVAVVPFDNLSDLRPETFGGEASDAIAVELRDRLFLDVLPKADITIQMRELGFTAPLSGVELVRVAAELEIVLLVTGQVRAARILDSREGRYAEVVLAVRLFDRLARDAVNGALVTGQGPASADASDEVLLRKALEQAAFQAIEEMRSRPTITAMVLWAQADKVFLNVGTRGGMRPGMKLVAIRGGERIAVVNVTDADAIGAYADVAEGASLRTGDHLRAIYELPRAGRSRAARVVEETGKRFDKLLIAAAVLFGMSGFASRARLLDETNIAFPRLAVSNMSNAAEMAYSIFPYDVWTGAVLITWEPFSNTQKSRILGCEIWADGEMVDVVLLDLDRKDYYIHMPAGRGLWEITFTVDVTTGAILDWISEPSTSDPGIEYTEDGTTYILAQSGPMAGVVHQYRLRAITLEQVQVSAGVYQWQVATGVEFSTPHMVIPVQTPFTFPIHETYAGYEQGSYEIWDSTPNPELFGNLATFYFYTPVGADEVIVQVTRDPNVNFDPAAIYSKVVTWDPNPTFPPPFPWPQASIAVDLTQVPGTGAIFWWRIGGRTRRDPIAPRPWPETLMNDYGFVWSQRNIFSLTAMSRADLLHQEREVLARSRTRAVRVPQRATGERVLRAQ